MLTRLAIFAVLGPIAGMAALVVAAVVLSGRLPSPADWPSVVVLAYIVGVLPALLVGAFDGWMAKRTTPIPRAILSAALGAVISFVPLATASLFGFSFGPAIGLYVLMDVCASVICSALSSLWDWRRAAWRLRGA